MLARFTSSKARTIIGQLLDLIQDTPVEITRTGDKPGGILVSHKIYDEYLEMKDDLELLRLVEERRNDKRVKVNFDDL